ncbi:hypothetical protein JYT61_01290 [bacterium AH-315-E10]|nr:hypothetical protein [bacterium AH-315-E10]
MISPMVETETETFAMRVEDMTRAVKFYRDVLHFRVERWKEDWCELRHNGFLLDLKTDPKRDTNLTSLTITVGNLDYACVTIESCGGSVIEKLDSVTRAIVSDTEGNRFTVECRAT